MKLIYSWTTWLEDIPGATIESHPLLGSYMPNAEAGGWKLEGRFPDAEVLAAVTEIQKRGAKGDKTPLKVVTASDKVPGVGKLSVLHHVPGYQNADC